MSAQKRVIIIGGTGFLGYYAVHEFLKKGWHVTALGLPPAPRADMFPPEVDILLRNLEPATSAELVELFSGFEALVFAAGLDDRKVPAKPSYPKFHHANVEVCSRILTSAGAAGVQRAVVLGSYYAHFERIWPEMELTRWHPYIRSRVEQEKAVTSIPGLAVNVLELPYIFGDPLGRRPLWYPLVQYIRSTPLVFYMKGGSACITAQTVGQAIVGAIERGQPDICYPIGDENLTWTQMLQRLAAADGREIRVVKLPGWLIRIGLLGLWLIQQIQGKEAGLNPLHFVSLQTAETFIDPRPSKDALGYELGGLDEAFKQTIRACN